MSEVLTTLSLLLLERESKLELANAANLLKFPRFTGKLEGNFTNYRRIQEKDLASIPDKQKSNIRSGPRGGLILLLTEEEYIANKQQRRKASKEELSLFWDNLLKEGTEEGYTLSDMIDLANLGPDIYKTNFFSNEIPKWMKSENQYKNQVFAMYSKTLLEAAENPPNEYDYLRVLTDKSFRSGGEFRDVSMDRLRFDLFKKYGMSDKGPVGGDIKPEFVPCWSCGTRLSPFVTWLNDVQGQQGVKSLLTVAQNALGNPNGYQLINIDKIFTKNEGGDYTLEWVLPSCRSCNLSRNDKSVFQTDGTFIYQNGDKAKEFVKFKTAQNQNGDSVLIPAFDREEWSEEFDNYRDLWANKEFKNYQFRKETPLVQATPKWQSRNIQEVAKRKFESMTTPEKIAFLKRQREQEFNNMTPQQKIEYIKRQRGL